MNGRVTGFLAFLAAFLLQYGLRFFLPAGVPVPALVLFLTAALVYLYQDSLLWMIYGAVFIFASDLLTGLWPGAGLLAVICVELLTLAFRYFFNVENLMNTILYACLVPPVYMSVLWLIVTLCGSTYSYTYMIGSWPFQIVYSAVCITLIWRVMLRRVVPHRQDRYFS